MPLGAGLLTIIAGAVFVRYLNNKKGANNKSSKSSTSAATSSAPIKSASSLSSSSTPTTAETLRTLLDPNEKYQLPLIEKEKLSHDTYRYRFGLPSSNHVLGLPVGQHVHLVATINEELVLRAYTPVSSDEDRGYVDLVIKVYHSGVHPKFPEGGKMSQYVNGLKIGDTIAFRGPSGKLQYLGNGEFAIKKTRKDPPVPIQATHVNMVSGGTGITPMLQLVRDVIKQPGDATKMALLFANQVSGV